jgi:hypothetical protein
LYRFGYTSRAISQIFHTRYNLSISHTTVSRWGRDNNITTIHKHNLNNDDNDIIIEITDAIQRYSDKYRYVSSYFLITWIKQNSHIFPNCKKLDIKQLHSIILNYLDTSTDFDLIKLKYQTSRAGYVYLSNKHIFGKNILKPFNPEWANDYIKELVLSLLKNPDTSTIKEICKQYPELKNKSCKRRIRYFITSGEVI